MIENVFIISYLALLAIILLYNGLLFLSKKDALPEKIQRLALAAFLVGLGASVVGFSYKAALETGGVTFDFPHKFFLIHDFLQNAYAASLILGPTTMLAFLFFISKSKKVALWAGGTALVLETFTLFATILI